MNRSTCSATASTCWAIEGESDEAEADALYCRTLQLKPVGELADTMRNPQRRLVEPVMRAKARDMPRMDAVEYLVSALEPYRNLDPEQQKQLLAAAVGQKGLSISTPE